jgi:hypothetical protein
MSFHLPAPKLPEAPIKVNKPAQIDECRSGLVLGFGGLPEPAIEQSVKLVAEALAAATTGG